MQQLWIVAVLLVAWWYAGYPSAQALSTRARTVAQSSGGVRIADLISSTRRPAADWSFAGATITNRKTPCTTSACNALFTGTVTATSIQNACASAPPETVVRIPAGSYSVSNWECSRSEITIRGDGTTTTKLTVANAGGGSTGFASQPSAVRLVGGTSQVGCGSSCGGAVPSTQTTWTPVVASAPWVAPQGMTTAMFASVSGLAVGEMVYFDQLDDSSDGYPSTGDLFVCAGGQPCSEEGGNQLMRSGRIQGQTARVTAIKGNVVTFTPGLHMPNWRSSQSPGVWWVGSVVQNTGIEDMTIDFTEGSGHGIFIKDGVNVWVKNVRLLKTNSSGSRVFHLWMLQSDHVTVTDSYFWGPTAVANVQYAVSPAGVSNCLIQNNVFHANVGGVITNDPVSGCVVAYNFCVEIRLQCYQTHGWETMALLEGNNFPTAYLEIVHGPHFFISLFRNHFDGYATNRQSATNNAGINAEAHNRFFNAVGNVIGHPHFTSYQASQTGCSDNHIYCFGAQDQLRSDSHVLRTFYRWGNWDSATSKNDNGTCDATGTRFLAGEVPSSIANYANVVPNTQALPASAYLAGRPPWWVTRFGTPAWPPHGPDVCNGNLSSSSGGHANKIPARLAYENSALDPAYPSSNPRIVIFEGKDIYAVTP